MAVLCERDSKPSGSVKLWEFFKWLWNCKLLVLISVRG